MRTRLGFGASLLAAGMTVAAGCESGDLDGMEEGESASTEQASTWANASDITIAQTFRPAIKFRSDHNCWPLTFTEIGSNASAAQRTGIKETCKSNLDTNFAIFASVKRRGTLNAAVTTDNDSFRVTYGVAFGMQENHLTDDEAAVYDIFGDPDMGTHGEDAQYIVADVGNGNLTSVWADLHKGYYARSKSQLTMHTDNQVTVWAGKWYNSLKLITEKTKYCDSGLNFGVDLLAFLSGLDISCDALDMATNFGDPIGENHTALGKLVMVEDVCATTGSTYTSPDNITYSGQQLAALKDYIGCSTEEYEWDKSFKSKSQYSDPYGLNGCHRGTSSWGNICNASNFGPDVNWRTTNGRAYVEPATVGNASPNSDGPQNFSDIETMYGNSPTEITIYTGERVDGVKVKYNVNGITTIKAHGTFEDDHAHTISGLDTDPITSVTLCEGTDTDGRRRPGRIELRTAAGRTLSGGSGSSKCVTSAPSGLRFFGFYGSDRLPSALVNMIITYGLDFPAGPLDFLGTYWGSDIPSSQSITDWFGDSNQGAGMAVTNIDSDSRPDAVVVHVDNPNGGNNGYYRILWNMAWVQPTSGSSTYLPTTISDPIPINGWWGDNTSGAGAAIGDIDKNGRPDLVVLHIDNPATSDFTYYRIGWNLNTSGVVTSWSAPIGISVGFHGYDTSGADVALRDIDNNGTLDMVIGTVDAPSGADTVYYNVGMNLSTAGIVSSWTGAGTLPSGISSATADLGMDMADMDRNGKPDLIVSWVDSASGNDSHYYRVGYDVTSTGSTSGWSAWRLLNSALSSSTHGADIAAYDFSGNNNMELANFHIVDGNGGNTGTWDVKSDRSDIVYALKGKYSQKCLTIQNGSSADGDKLVQYTCSGLASQKFTFSASDSGGYHLLIKSSGKCLDNPSSSTQNGTVQQQWSCNYSNAQRFQLTSPTTDYFDGPIYWRVQNAGNNLCLDVAGNSISNNGNIVQWTCSDIDRQKFELVQITN